LYYNFEKLTKIKTIQQKNKYGESIRRWAIKPKN